MKKKFFAIFGVVAIVGGIVLGTGTFNRVEATGVYQTVGSANMIWCRLADGDICPTKGRDCDWGTQK